MRESEKGLVRTWRR